MQEDILEIVDESDRVVGRAPRSLAHAKGLRHRAVHVMVFNDHGQLFSQKRSMSKDTWPGAWDSSCSGHVDAGEDYAQAAVRELSEELGFRPEAELEFLFQLLPGDDTGQEFINVYRVSAEGPFTLQPEEIETGEWVEPARLMERMKLEPSSYASAFRSAMAQLLDRGLLGDNGSCKHD